MLKRENRSVARKSAKKPATRRATKAPALASWKPIAIDIKGKKHGGQFRVKPVGGTRARSLIVECNGESERTGLHFDETPLGKARLLLRHLVTAHGAGP